MSSRQRSALISPTRRRCEVAGQERNAAAQRADRDREQELLVVPTVDHEDVGFRLGEHELLGDGHGRSLASFAISARKIAAISSTDFEKSSAATPGRSSGLIAIT